MTDSEKYKITSNDYFDILIRYNGDINSLEKYSRYSPHIMSQYLAVIYIPISEIRPSVIRDFGYVEVPKCYSLDSEQSLSASGVIRLRRIPAINLRGRGVIVGIIDTGIDYTNPVFMHEDGSSKIIAIWDQTIESDDQYPQAFHPTFFGTEYTNEQINQALKSENPLQVVPSIDEIGHGTKMAGIAAGSENRENDFSGVAPDAEFLVVKLKQAKKNLTDFYFIPENIPCYQENNIIWAIYYLIHKIGELKRPLALCIGIGTSQGPHDNSGYLNVMASIYADTAGVAMSIAVGNEGSSRRHFYSTLDPSAGPISVELNVGANDAGFSMELWGDPPTIYSLDMVSPSGEVIPRISETLEASQVISFVFIETVIYVDYIMIEQESGKQLILLRFQKPSEGVWRFNVYGKGDLKGAFHIWLPSNDFISRDTYFVNSNPYTTITSPANNFVPMSVTAYNSNNDTLYTSSGKGFSTSNIINPNLAAPGVDLQCPALNHSFTTMTGTSAAVAHAAGITAMLLEWCIVDNNYPGIDTIGITKFLMRGARRSTNLIYPNRDWGYGIIDIYNTFNVIRADI